MASPAPRIPEPPAPVEPSPLVLDGSPSPNVLSAMPDFALGVAYLIAWVAPGLAGPGMVRMLMLGMMLEFIVVHSAAFTGQVLVGDGTQATKLRGLLGLGLLYSLFAGGFALAFHTLWPLIAFWTLMLNRMSGVLLGQAPSGEQKAFVQRSWIGGAVAYLVFAALSSLPVVPRLGCTSEMVARFALPGSGIWVEQPWHVLAFGFAYFTATALMEIDGFRMFRNAEVDGKRVG